MTRMPPFPRRIARYCPLDGGSSLADCCLRRLHLDWAKSEKLETFRRVSQGSRARVRNVPPAPDNGIVAQPSGSRIKAAAASRCLRQPLTRGEAGLKSLSYSGAAGEKTKATTECRNPSGVGRDHRAAARGCRTVGI
jgi:hypothetical protein